VHVDRIHLNLGRFISRQIFRHAPVFTVSGLDNLQCVLCEVRGAAEQAGFFKSETRCVLCEVPAEAEETVDHRASNERRYMYF
jgi:hypothetical protein